MKNFGIVSYNIRCNFTNYGSALQSWALKETIERLGKGKYHVKLVDYCSKAHLKSNPLSPFENMWDQDEESRRNCELSMPAIKENYYKFEKFYNNEFDRTKKMYTYKNFNEIIKDENIDGFVCGSDTIFCVDEFGIDEVFYANVDCMKNGYTVSYAASFGDSHFDDESYKEIDKRLKNFKYIGIRENEMLTYIKKRVDFPVERVLDPTLLLKSEDYEKIISKNIEEEKYILLYARRRNNKMFEYAEELAKKNNWKIIEISLRASESKNHKIFYEAGIEEFLSLVKNAEYVVTNSFHGMIFSVQFRKQFVIFSREQCDAKIEELLEIFGLKDRLMTEGNELFKKEIDYDAVHQKIEKERKSSIEFLKMELNGIESEK